MSKPGPVKFLYDVLENAERLSLPSSELYAKNLLDSKGYSSVRIVSGNKSDCPSVDSGLQRDIRVEAPYGSYNLFPINIVTATAGDLENRFIVRLNELFETYKTLHNLIDKLPPGELTTKMPRRIPAGETISRVEAPRGELFYFLKSNGTDKPERVKIRTPSICNFGSVIKLAVGSQMADIPMLLAGIDPCFSCNDR